MFLCYNNAGYSFSLLASCKLLKFVIGLCFALFKTVTTYSALHSSFQNKRLPSWNVSEVKTVNLLIINRPLNIELGTYLISKISLGTICVLAGTAFYKYRGSATNNRDNYSTLYLLVVMHIQHHKFVNSGWSIMFQTAHWMSNIVVPILV